MNYRISIEIPVADLINPVVIFINFLEAVRWSTDLLIDWLLSGHEDFLCFLLGLLKLINYDRSILDRIKIESIVAEAKNPRQFEKSQNAKNEKILFSLQINEKIGEQTRNRKVTVVEPKFAPNANLETKKKLKFDSVKNEKPNEKLKKFLEEIFQILLRYQKRKSLCFNVAPLIKQLAQLLQK